MEHKIRVHLLVSELLYEVALEQYKWHEIQQGRL